MFNVIRNYEMAMEEGSVCLSLSLSFFGENGAAYVMVTMSRNFVKGSFYEAVTPRLAY